MTNKCPVCGATLLMVFGAKQGERFHICPNTPYTNINKELTVTCAKTSTPPPPPPIDTTKAIITLPLTQSNTLTFSGVDNNNKQVLIHLHTPTQTQPQTLGATDKHEIKRVARAL